VRVGNGTPYGRGAIIAPSLFAESGSDVLTLDGQGERRLEVAEFCLRYRTGAPGTRPRNTTPDVEDPRVRHIPADDARFDGASAAAGFSTSPRMRRNPSPPAGWTTSAQP
jgi:hypothetical protein